MVMCHTKAVLGAWYRHMQGSAVRCTQASAGNRGACHTLIHSFPNTRSPIQLLDHWIITPTPTVQRGSRPACDRSRPGVPNSSLNTSSCARVVHAHTNLYIYIDVYVYIYQGIYLYLVGFASVILNALTTSSCARVRVCAAFSRLCAHVCVLGRCRGSAGHDAAQLHTMLRSALP